MKKFLVSILGIFLLFGTVLLAACGETKPSLTLSQDVVEIQLYADDEDSGYEIVTATLSGVGSGSIQASALSGYENIVRVSTSTLSSNRSSIRIEGLEEGTAQVVVRATPGNVEKRINVTVYSEVSAMTQIIENTAKKNNFLIRGQDNILVEEKLISFEPSSKSRRELTWSISDEMNMAGGLELDGTTLFVDSSFVGSEVKLVATTFKDTEKEVSTAITLPVIDKIESEVKLAFSYSQNSSFDEINEENNEFNIVPNIPGDDMYTGYILVDYVGDLEITPYVTDAVTGRASDDIQVLPYGSYEGKPLYTVYASKDKPDINKDYKVGFQIGYENYNYFIDTTEDFPLTIKAREMVNGITISTAEASNIAGSLQTLYTNYADAESAAINGQRFDISITPTTVVDATKKYSIDVERFSAGGGAVADGCPVEIYYRDGENGNVWTQVILTANGSHYITREEDFPTATTLYIKASSTLKEQTVEGYRITFTSQDNTDISTTFNLRLVKSASVSEFAFNDAGFRIDSSNLSAAYKKQFTLRGQTSIDGLYIVNNSKNVNFEEIKELSHDAESVTFEVSVSLKNSSYGQTSVDSYQIAHRNGLITDNYALDIFLPLKYSAMYVDTAENVANSVIDYALNSKVYTTSGTEGASSVVSSLSKLILKNNTTTPLFYTYNAVNGISAVANIGVSFYDFDSENDELNNFKDLINTQQGVLTIIRGAQDRGETSGVASFSVDRSSILTKGSGYTYAVVTFTGKGVGDGVDNNGNVTYVRIIYIESFVTPEGLNVTPAGDKNVTLYSIDTLATSDEALTRKAINIRFNNSNITYKDFLSNLEFVSTNSDMGRARFSGDTVTWDNGSYSLANVKITEEGISFTILALSIANYSETVFTDTLNVHYVVRESADETSRKIYDIYTPIDIVIQNAQRIESLKWKNYDEDGLYFEVGDNQPQYMLLETGPIEARNKNVAYIITNSATGSESRFVTVSDEISSNILSINLSSSIKSGMVGYAYILPADAVYNHQIRYFYKNGNKEVSASISDNDLPSMYDYLVSNAYFKSNAQGQDKEVKFSDILIKVKITVADGKSFDYAYRVYDNATFLGMRPELYYTVMNNLDLTGEGRSAISSFTGGLQGYNSDVTVKLDGANFAGTIDATAEIRNITFIGDITTGSGFVANTNNGKITNVTIDVCGLRPSCLVSTTDAGGIVGENNGTISGARVLGVNLTGEGYVGGIAGKNNGTISYSSVEFYRLESGSTEGAKTYDSNKFVGNTVGGIVGLIGNGSKIDHSYAYDYTMSSNSASVLYGSKLGLFAGVISENNAVAPTINYSFAILGGGIIVPCLNFDNDMFTNSFYSYYDGGVYGSSVDEDIENVNFVTKKDNDPAFKDYANNGFPHLRELVQDEPVSSVNGLNVQTFDENGYYKSLAVEGSSSESRGILFNYALKNEMAELSTSEQNGLNALNTISLSDLVGNTVSKNVIASSSNSAIVKVLGSSLQILKNGEVTITLSSKQNVENNKQIRIKVVYALSNLFISWTDSAGRVTYVQEDAQLTLQKTHSRFYGVNFENSQVFLGNLASAYEIKQNDDITLDIKTAKAKINESGNISIDNSVEGNEVNVPAGDINISGFRVLTDSSSVLTNFDVSPKVFSEDSFQKAVADEFTRHFYINAIEGVIAFDISGESLPLTPSTNAKLEVRIRTTDAEDTVYPVISYNGLKLERSFNDDRQSHLYTIKGQDTAIIEATVRLVKEEKQEGSNLNTFIYNVVFAVNADYKASVSQEMEFDVYMESKSGNTSEDWNGEFKLHLTRQNFTNIDVSNRKIANSVFRNYGNGVVEVHTAGEATAVLAPGNSSILQINVNPSFAYYDHVDLVYSNATVPDALNIEVVSPSGNDNEFARRVSTHGEIETVGSGLRFYPEADEKGTLYYKLWVNTSVNRDSTLKITAYFYDANSETPISYVNYYLTISYLTEPTITVDGASTAYVARGSYANIQIDVLADQSIDSLMLADDDGRRGISITQPSEPVVDKEKNIKTYTATMYASVMSTATNDTIYVTAQISRELNGTKEFKTSIATVVLVDFKIQENSIVLDKKPEGNITIWQGVNKSISVDYELLPEDYGAASSPEMEKVVAELREKRDAFSGAQYYPAHVEIVGKNEERQYHPYTASELEGYKYFINYKYNEAKELEVQTLKDRLFIISGNNRYPMPDENDNSLDIPFVCKFDEKTNSIVLTGTRLASSVQMVLKTYISAGGITREIETFFTVTVRAFSDPDLPLLIKNAAEFKNLNPSSSSSEDATPQDYILTSDILLENYTAFDTSLIKSLDGNGYTIHIKSFNVSPENSSSLNLALFNNVSEDTILKNIRVNLYNGGQITVDTYRYSDINIAGLAIENAGIITNCEVVSFYTQNSAAGDVEALNYAACEKHNKPSGINVTYTRGENTNPIYMVDNADWSTQIAGFVISNQGSITNSRVGGDTITVLGDEKKVAGEASGRTYASIQELETFHIIGQGNMAGFVLNNTNGNVSASYVKRLDMENQSLTTQVYAAGFVGVNTSTINTSYIEGVPTPKATLEADPTNYSEFAYEGSSIRSSMGYVVGFVYRNDANAQINDSYSNILISNTNDSNSVYLASGFVYENSGTIENGYSASQIRNQMNTQMNFSGVDRSGQLLANGSYINCYFFNKQYDDVEDTTDDTTETQFNTGAIMIPEPDNESLFYGFAVANGENDGIWKIVENEGIFLISTDFVSHSHRYIHRVNGDLFEGMAGEDNQGKYILPYSTLTYTDSAAEINTSLGGEYNPIIIKDAQDFIEISGTSTSSYVQEYFNGSAIWGTYRLVDNINLTDIASGDNVITLPSSTKAFAGTLYGNGFTISGLSIASEQAGVGFGLFKSIEKRGRGSNPVVKNLNIEVTQVDGSVVTMAGALAGYIKDAVIISIDINFEENATVTGLNFAGGLAGFVFGDNTIKCITVEDPNVRATRSLRDDEADNNYFISSTDGNNDGPLTLQVLRTRVNNNLNYNTSVGADIIDNTLSNYSYAGGVIGFADIFKTNNLSFDINQASNYNVRNVRVSGVIKVEGQVAGGAFGLTGYQTNLRDIGVTITGGSDSHILATKYFAGGLVGQSFGSLSRVFTVYDKTTQDNIENNIGNFYNGNYGVERGNLDIFYEKGTSYTQKYVGGIIGIAFSGNIEISYSKLNVAAPSADYAGGIIGGLDLNNASAYQLGVEGGGTSYYSSYFINEVYATGDVRANTHTGFAGGIVGRIIGASARVGMQSVNAFNYFTHYNYEEDKFNEIDEAAENFSTLYKVNTLVGRFAKIQTNSAGQVIGGAQDVSLEEATQTYTNYLNLIEFYGMGGDSDSGEAVKPKASVGYYEGYYKNSLGRLIGFNLFGNLSGKIDKTNNTALDNIYGTYVYAIESPSSFTNSSTGYQYTNTGFLGSDVWSENNWEHNMQELFPTIKYKRSSSVIYWDYYNTEKVFKTIKDNNHTVYIRGLASEGSDEYRDIDLREFYKDAANRDIKIVGFAGRLRGGVYPTEGKKIKIITDRNFIESVAPGFSAVDVEVQYVQTDPNAEENNRFIEVSSQGNDLEGLFINSTAEGITITGLRMEITCPVRFSVTGNQDSYIGLIASQIKNSTLSNIYIGTPAQGSKSALMSISGTSANAESGKTLYAGAIAGSIEHSSTNAHSTVEKIEIQWNGDLIDVNTSGFNGISNYNVGGYVGLASADVGGEFDLDFELNGIYRNNSSTSTYSSNITHISITGTKNAESISVGGYVGTMGAPNKTGVSRMSLNEAKDINISFNIGVNAETLNSGSLVGSLNKVKESMNMDFMQSNIKTGLYVSNGKTIKTLKAGGIVGSLTDKISIINAKSIEFSVTDNESTHARIESEKERLDINYKEKDGDPSTLVNVSDYAYIGGLVGFASSACTKLTVSGSMQINKRGEDNTVNSFRINGTSEKVYMGSVLGYTEGSIDISGDIKSDTEFMIVSEETGLQTTIGGFVGGIGFGGANIIQGNNLAQYDGAVYSNVKKLTFGGIVGSYAGATGSELEITNTSFGGSVKIYGNNSDDATIITGGTIGDIISSANGAVDTNSFMLVENKNYGDVFVEYNDKDGIKFVKLNSYTFGGVLGKISSDVAAKESLISNNYSIMTTHNAKYKDSHDNGNTVNALFGVGITNEILGSSKNYYSHAISLSTDELGYDIAYESATIYRGYDWENDKSDVEGKNILSSFTLVDEVNKKDGSKLKPQEFIPAIKKLKESESFNGLKYYLIKYDNASSATINSVSGQIVDSDSNSNLKNIAIIGGSGKVVNYNGNNAKISAIIDQLSGHSFISGFEIDVDVSYDLGDTDTAPNVVAPLVREMVDNSTVYAINIKGTFDVGGVKSPEVSGLVGVLKSGRIFDSSTELDIIYRATGKTASGSFNNVYGITKLDDENDSSNTSAIYRVIENTFASGSIKTYISANIFAFANSETNSVVKNCYAINKLDLNDYTLMDSKMDTAAKISVFGQIIQDSTSEYKNNYFDYDALNYTSTALTNEKGSAKTFTELRTGAPFDSYTTKWVTDYSYNFGYPTLKYQYLKTSSFAFHDTREEQHDGTVTKASMTKLERLKDVEKQTFKDSNGTIIKDENLYDNYIQENKYVQLPNGHEPTTYVPVGEGVTEEVAGLQYNEFDCFFMIPNAALLKFRETIYNFYPKRGDGVTIANQKKFTNFILKYDIDLDNIVSASSENYNSQEGSEEFDFEFKGKFDGQNKTINSLQRMLFYNISGSKENNEYKTWVINLRLTNVEFTAVTSLTPVLADYIDTALISNITVSGTMNLGNLPAMRTFGVLTNTIKSSEVNTVQNMVEFTVKSGVASTSVIAGGIVGAMKDSRMLFCSNYGPLNVSTAENNEVLALGGLVGLMQGTSKIDYSYNATSVLGNYISGKTTSTTKGKFFTGGLVGYLAAGTISNSYNSGMIKSGNKSNVNDSTQSGNGSDVQLSYTPAAFTFSANGETVSNTGILNASYAGGVIGYAAGGEVTKCYNEGTVEALGKDPEYKWKWIDSTPSNTSDNWIFTSNVNGNKDNGYKVDTSYLMPPKNSSLSYPTSRDALRDPGTSNLSVSSSYVLKLYNLSARNVYAFGIGYEKNENIINNSQIRVSKEKGGDTTTIYSNGSGMDKKYEKGTDNTGAEIYSLPLTKILQTLKDQGLLEEFYTDYSLNHYYKFWIIYFVIPIFGFPIPIIIVHTQHNYTFNGLEFLNQMIQPMLGDIKEIGEYHTDNSEVADSEAGNQTTQIKTLSRNSQNVPTAFSLTFENGFSVTYFSNSFHDELGVKYGGKDSSNFSLGSLKSGHNITTSNIRDDTKFTTDRTGNVKSGYSGVIESRNGTGRDAYYDLIYRSSGNVAGNYEKIGDTDVQNDYSKISNKGNQVGNSKNNTASTSDNASVKQYTRSQENSDDTSKISINGKNYYLANRNNMSTIFSAGITSVSKTMEVPSEGEGGLPFINNVDRYTINVTPTNGGKPINAKIKKVYQKTISNKPYTCVDYDLFTSDETGLQGNYKVEIGVNSSQDIELRLDDLRYYYTDETSIGISFSNIPYKILSDYTIYYHDEFMYNVIRISTEKFTYLNEPDDGDSRYIYLFFKEDEVNGSSGIFTYAPNVKLYNAQAKEFEVNKSSINLEKISQEEDENKKRTDFNKAVEDLINNLTKNSSYFVRSVNEKIFSYVNLDGSVSKLSQFTDYMNGEKSFKTQDSQSVTQVSYGESLSGIVKSVGYASVTNHKNYKVELNLSKVPSDMIALNGKTPILSYKKSSNTLAMEASTLNINGGTYIARRESDNKILIEVGESGHSDEIENYFNNLEYIVNKSTITVSDRFAGESDDIVVDMFDINGQRVENNTATIKRSIVKTWKIGSQIVDSAEKNFDLFTAKRVGNNIEIKIKESAAGIEKYQGSNGITIYKGTINLSLTESYISNFTDSIELKNSTSERVFFDIEIRYPTGVIKSYSDLTAAQQHIVNMKDMNWDLTGNYKISVTYRPSYITKSTNIDEAYQYNLLLQDKTGGLHYIDVTFNPSDKKDDSGKPLEEYSLSIGSVVRTYKYNGQEIAMSVLKTERKVQDGQGKEINATKYTYLVGNFQVYSYEYRPGFKDETGTLREHAYTTFYDSKGEAITGEPLKDEDGNYKRDDEGNILYQTGDSSIDPPTEIYFPGNPKGTISKDPQLLSNFIGKKSGKVNIENLPNPNDYSDILGQKMLTNSVPVKPLVDEKGNVIRDDQNNIRYLTITKYNYLVYVKGDYSVVKEEFTKKFYTEEDERTFATAVRINQVEYTPIDMPSYSPIEKSFDYAGMDIDGTIKSKYLITGNKEGIKIYLRHEEESYLSIKAKLSGGKTESHNLSSSGAVSALDIILTSNISFIENINEKIDRYNIIGNGYSISYYGDAFFNILDRTNSGEVLAGSYISNVNFLGEVYGKRAMINNSEQDVGVGENKRNNTFYNVSVYGSAVNVEASNDSILINGNSSIYGFTSYAAINVVQGENGEVNSYLLNNVRDSSTTTEGKHSLKGVIFTASGRQGASKGKYEKGESSAYIGGTGSSAVSIKAGERIKFVNDGFILLGVGGNGGAGGWYQYSKIISTQISGGAAGANATAESFDAEGSKGSIMNVGTAQVGKEGMRQRIKMNEYLKSNLTMKNTENQNIEWSDYPYEGTVIDFKAPDGSSDSISYSGSRQDVYFDKNHIERLFNSIFNLNSDNGRVNYGTLI